MYIFVILFLLSIPFLNFKVPQGFAIDKEKSYNVRSLLAILIILFHCRVFFNESGIWNSFISEIGAIICAVFFILSGYGLFLQRESIQNMTFKNYYKKRIANILCDYIVLIFVYQLLELYSGNFSLSNILLNLSVGEVGVLLPYSWFIVMILILYGLVYLSARSKLGMIICTSGGVIILYLTLLLLKFGPWWYNSIFALPFGMYIALLTERKRQMRSFYFLYISSLTLMFIHLIDGIEVLKSLANPVIALGLIYILTSFPLGKIAGRLSKYSFLIYTFQGIAIIIASKISNNPILISLFAVIISILSAIIYDEIKNRIRRVIHVDNI